LKRTGWLKLVRSSELWAIHHTLDRHLHPGVIKQAIERVV